MLNFQQNLLAQCQPCDKETFTRLTVSDNVVRTIERVRKAKAEGNNDEAARLKKSLPGLLFQCTMSESTSKNGIRGTWRRQTAAVLNGLYMCDFDHVETPRKVFDEVIRPLMETDKDILLVFITPSGQGLKVVAKAHTERGNLAANQAWLAAQLGMENDEACKDASRLSFCPKLDDILYINDDELFTYNNKEYDEAWGPSYRGEQPSPITLQPTADVQEPTANTQEPAPTFKGIAYDDIISEWWQQQGGEPCEGERNVKLHQLAVNLKPICDNDKELLLSIMPRLGLAEQEVRSIVDSACKEQPKAVSKAMDSILHKLQQAQQPSALGDTPPEMPRRLPRLIQLLTRNTPAIYRPAVAHAVFPSLGAHLVNTTFRYIDNKLHEATFMNCLMAGTGAGKECISDPIDHIMADIRLRDAENLAREKKWKEEVNTKGANKDKSKRPAGLVIQEIDADMTHPAFVMRTAEAEGHFLYTKLNEIDQFDALKGNGSGGQQFRIMCLAFDPNNRYGQTRVGTQSVTERVCIRFNWNATTTIQKGKRYFQRVITDGPVSRINFCTIPEREIGAEIPVYGEYDAQFDEELKPYIDRLNAARGEVKCPQAVRLARKLNEECAEFARLSQSRTYENFSFRANVIAYIKACVLYVANGEKWDKSIEDFIRWSLRYDLWCKMKFFGEATEQANNAQYDSSSRGPQNMLTFLPDTFTYEDAVRVRVSQSLPAKGTGNMLSQWKSRKYILQMTDDSFQKLKYRSTPLT